MNCREFADFLNLYFEEELSVEERAVFDGHLSECEACRAYLDGYRKTVYALHSASFGSDVFEQAPEELIEAILATRPR